MPTFQQFVAYFEEDGMTPGLDEIAKHQRIGVGAFVTQQTANHRDYVLKIESPEINVLRYTS